MVKLSIIVPIYNVERYLERCIISILNQTYVNFELILVNDGSTDNSKDICEKYLSIDNRIKLINKKNGGVSSARNTGIELAIGEYIAFVDPDDYINKYMYEVLITTLKKDKSDMVICGYNKVDQNEINFQEINNHIDVNNVRTSKISKVEALDKLLIEGEKFVFAWNKIYKRKLFNELRYKNGKIYEDEFLAHRVLYRCNKVSVINEKLYFYIQRDGSIVNSKFTTKKFDKVYALKERIDFFKEKNLLELKEKAEKSFVDYFIWNYFVAYQRLENVNSDLIKLKNEFNKVFFEILKNTKISWKEKLTLSLLYISPKAYNFIILRNTL